MFTISGRKWNYVNLGEPQISVPKIVGENELYMSILNQREGSRSQISKERGSEVIDRDMERVILVNKILDGHTEAMGHGEKFQQTLSYSLLSVTPSLMILILK